ncbi:hypothetical protein J2W36_003038 [Variovorax ginsengisoli]|uniref:Integrase catalytic domain-containing protein n=1 Tax=Variovorax ginsengisoli TaxID=363844 RepID=A0ABT9SBN2_9BURK|nr:hypothetical protein [Variovorax ginsengisoli]
MSIHKHARLTFARRLEMVKQMILEGLDAVQAAAAHGSFMRPCQPQTNGKAERFIQSALREWAYGWTYQNSAHRADAPASWQQCSAACSRGCTGCRRRSWTMSYAVSRPRIWR